MHPHRERPRDGHPVPGTFVTVPTCLTRQRAHQERPRRHHHHLRALRAIAKSGPHRRQLRRGRRPKAGDGQVAQVAGGALHQAHHLHRAAGGDEELPPPRAVAQAPYQSHPARLELLCAHHARTPRRHRESHRAPRPPLPRIVACGHRHGHTPRRSVHHPQPAPLRTLAGGVEYRNVVHNSAPGVASGARHRVHRSEEPARHPRVGRGLDVQRRRQLQAPVPPPVAEPPAQPLRRIAPLQVPGVEVAGLACLQSQVDRPAPPPRIVDAGDAHRPRCIRVIDDPNMALLSVTRGPQQRKVVPCGLRRRHCDDREHGPEHQCRGQARRGRVTKETTRRPGAPSDLAGPDRAHAFGATRTPRRCLG